MVRENGIDYLFGFAGNKILKRLVEETADDIRTRRALENKPVLRGYADTRYGAKSWKVERRVCARGQAENLIKMHKSQPGPPYPAHRSLLVDAHTAQSRDLPTPRGRLNTGSP